MSATPRIVTIHGTMTTPNASQSGFSHVQKMMTAAMASSDQKSGITSNRQWGRNSRMICSSSVSKRFG